jgi:hypothetical protein
MNKASDSSRTPERRSHRPKVDTGQTEGHRSIEELAGEKGGCKVSPTKTQPTPTKKSHGHHSPHPRRANKTSDTTHPSTNECTGQHSNVLVQRRRSHSNVKQSPLEKRKATNIFPARPGTKSGMSLRNSVDINLSSRFQQSTPTGPKNTHPPPLSPVQTTPQRSSSE